MKPMIEVLGLNEITQRMNDAGTQGKISVNEGLRKIGRIFVESKGTGAIASATPKITGKLARSTAFSIQGGISDTQSLMITQGAKSAGGAFYGQFVREGTKPHVILPRKGKYLRFEIGGRVVYTKRVNHPGSKPNPYHKRVYDAKRNEVNKIITEMGNSITAYLAG